MSAPQTSVLSYMVPGYAGAIVDTSPHEIRSYVSQETTEEIGFGTAVVQGTDDNQCLRMDAGTDKLLGIVAHSHAYEKDIELGDYGIKAYMTVGVMVKGVIWVTVDEAVAMGGAVRVRNDDTAGSNTSGTFRTTSSASHTVDISKFARWRSSTTGAGVAQLEFDFTMASNAAAD